MFNLFLIAVLMVIYVFAGQHDTRFYTLLAVQYIINGVAAVVLYAVLFFFSMQLPIMLLFFVVWFLVYLYELRNRLWF